MNLKLILIKFLLKSRKVSFLDRKNLIFEKVKNSPDFKIETFGKKNQSKIFYVIKRIKGGGLFSNFLFVLNHLLVAEKLKMIPVIDMENFSNLYNEKRKVKGTFNSWLYYFEPVSNYSLAQVYKSKFVVFSSEKIFSGQSLSFKDNFRELSRVYKKYIKIKKEYLDLSKKFIKLNNIGKHTLSVHWRGTDHKVLPGHPMPPTKKQIFNLINEKLKNKKFKNIFVVTEQKKYLSILKKNFQNIKFLDSFRSDFLKDFSNYDRKSHRFRLGKDSLIETLILANTNFLICSRSNISEVAVLFSNNKLKVKEIKNGYNSKSIFFSLFKWKIKNFLPKFLGGFG
tara:strand:- start:981 stop:1997 length:1017 start_codon:yes stop_codon:yes gene_type:complete